MGSVFTRFLSKIIYLLFFCIVVFNVDISAQTEIFGFGGYMMTSSVPAAKGYLRVDDKPNYGLGVDIVVGNGLNAEFLWISEMTHIDLEHYPSGVKEDLFDVDVHYFQVGALQEFKKKKVRPFAAITAGATLFHPREPGRGDEWLASFTLGGGAKIYMSENVGLRLQGRLLFPVVFSGASLWVGTGGAGVSVGSWSAFVQYDLTAGIFIKLGK